MDGIIRQSPYAQGSLNISNAGIEMHGVLSGEAAVVQAFHAFTPRGLTDLRHIAPLCGFFSNFHHHGEKDKQQQCFQLETKDKQQCFQLANQG